MTLKQNMNAIAVALLLAAAPFAHAAKPSPAAVAQKTFASPAEAAQALADAVRAGSAENLLAVVGPKSRTWLFSGDNVADRDDWNRFLVAYEKRHAITEAAGGNSAVLTVGEDDWPFPAPLKQKGERWAFDAAAGREEVINRRVGRNELSTMQTLLAIVDAQREYAATDPDRDGYHDYARRFRSSEGKKDGLFWPTAAGDSPSPLGELVAQAAREGYGKAAKGSAGKPAAFHGYRYRLLTSQGKQANGGAYSYLVNDRLLGGFAVVAYPATYGVSGVMTFIVNHEGVVYQKNLGAATEAEAEKMRAFNPDASWKKE